MDNVGNTVGFRLGLRAAANVIPRMESLEHFVKKMNGTMSQ